MRRYSDWGSILALAVVLVLPLAYIWQRNRTAREIVEKVEDVSRETEARVENVVEHEKKVVERELEPKRSPDVSARSFDELVRKHFRAWSKGDDALSFSRVDALLRDRNIKHEEAAALAAVHSYFTSHDRVVGKKEVLALSVTQQDLLARAEEHRLEARFRNYRNHLHTVNRELFAEGSPTRDGIAQGYLGDCFLLATVGSTLETQPDLLRRMIRTRLDGSYEVTFKDGETIQVPSLSDGLIVLGSRAGKQGLWLNVLETAYGEHRLAKTHQREELPEDTLNGGQPTHVMGLFTGRRGKFMWFKSHELTDTLLSAFLHAGVQKKRLMVVNTSKHGKLPPHIIHYHCYAVLGFEPTTHRVKIWNPWGAALNFRPGGPAGLEHGFAIHSGVFEVPLHDFRHIFAGLSFD